MGSLTRIGTSWGIIIPAKILKKRNYNKDTVFDIKEDGKNIILSPRITQTDMKLPKLSEPIRILPEMKQFCGSASFTEEEISNDPRLEAILGL